MLFVLIINSSIVSAVEEYQCYTNDGAIISSINNEKSVRRTANTGHLIQLDNNLMTIDMDKYKCKNVGASYLWNEDKIEEFSEVLICNDDGFGYQMLFNKKTKQFTFSQSGIYSVTKRFDTGNSTVVVKTGKCIRTM